MCELSVVIVLGRKLEADGTASPDLINRVALGRRVATEIANAKVVLSGGKLVFAADNSASAASEASVMRTLLLQAPAPAIDASDVLLDEQSTHTLENAVFARRLVERLMESASAKQAHVHLVTSQVHMRRARTCFEGVFLRPAERDAFTLTAHASQDGERVIPSEKEGEIEAAMIRRLPHDLKLYEEHDVATARLFFFTPNPAGPDGEPHPHTWLYAAKLAELGLVE